MQFKEYISEDKLPIIEIEETSPDTSYVLKKGSVVIISTTTTTHLEKEEKHVR